MKGNEERDALLREDWSRVYAEMPDSVRGGVESALARIHVREARRRRVRRAMLCAACLVLALCAARFALPGRKHVPDRVAQPPVEAAALDDMDVVFAAKDDPCFHLDENCPERRGDLVELRLITALEFEKERCALCCANVRLSDGA